MSTDFYAKQLARFKENEKAEPVLLIADEPNLIKVVVAWTNITVTRATKLSPLRGDSESKVWEWLWKNVIYSREELIAKSALSEHGFDRKMTPLIGNRVLYPDGTINSFVQRYLRDRVLKLFDAKPRRPAKKKY
ncbi:MAG: hypothetical protein JSV16_13145 [Candidatus Hydrogenedentota bacterium]|nr:MAG: hypothetical protein JSV16_13145 [Candidatus Hydrogenedentota bacterium]